MNYRSIVTLNNYKRAILIKIKLFLLIIFLNQGVYAQTSTLSISATNETLESVLKKIESQSEYLFFYNTNEVNKNIRLSIHKENSNIQEVLDAISKEINLNYTIKDRHVVFSQKAENTNAEKKLLVKNINGRITNEKGEPLSMVSIIEKRSMKGVLSDNDGNYSLALPNDISDPALMFSFIGYKNLEENIDNRSVINIVMSEDVSKLDELIVVGYTTQRRGLLTGAVTTMDMTDDLKTIPTTSPSNLLTGRMAGVNIQTPNGIPGSNPKISIRTASSWQTEEIVVVIDGIIRDLDQFNKLSINEIENVTVLKDAASAAIYGSRSAGGVILITTKRGKLGKPVFNYSYSLGIDTRTKNASLTDAVQTGELYNRINGKSDPAGWAWSQEELDHYKNIDGGWGYNQLDAVWKDPSIQSHNLSVTGGSEKI